jgi:hypothetical protein
VGYDELRRAIQHPWGLFVDNLWKITRAADALSRASDVKQPAAFRTLAEITERLARRWDVDRPLPVESAELIDAHLVPRLLALVDVASSDESQVVENAISAALQAEADAFNRPSDE